MHVLMHLSKPMECIPTVNPNVNYRFWVIGMGQHRFLDRKKCTTPRQDVDSEGGYVCVGAGVYENSA